MKTKRNSPVPPSIKGHNAAPFPYQDYLKAQKELTYELQHSSCFYALLLGASGMGKTTLLRDVQKELDHHRTHVIYLSSSLISAVGIVRALALKMHVSPRRSYLETVQVLAEAIAAQSSHVLLWVDEADQVDGHTLQEIRMVAESTLKTEQLFSLVLSGLPALAQKLDAPDLFPLKRRITLRFTLAGVRREELVPFLEHRFGAEDASRFPQEVHDELFERTQGTPALIDQFCRYALTHQASSSGPMDREVFHALLDTASF